LHLSNRALATLDYQLDPSEALGAGSSSSRRETAKESPLWRAEECGKGRGSTRATVSRSLSLQAWHWSADVRISQEIEGHVHCVGEVDEKVIDRFVCR